MKEKAKKGFWRRRWWVIPVALILIVLIVFLIYTAVYYRADVTAQAAMRSDGTVKISRTDYGWHFDGPSEGRALIFYPGAKVEATAYAPLLHMLAAAGTDVCLVEMPLRLAFFDSDAATEVMKAHTYSEYYIGGHSLGGAMAAKYAASHGKQLSGVVLLGAYATEKLPSSMTEILIVGSEDKVVNAKKIRAGRAYAPEKYYELTLPGGNHAQFGSYGKQSGDGKASISPYDQWSLTVTMIMEHLG